MSNSMQHWNGHQLAAIDVETTGLDPFWHEIIQICIMPLDSNAVPRRDITPFYIEMRPDYPERVDKNAMTVNMLNLSKITDRGFDKEKAKDLLLDWKEKLGLPITPSGIPKTIMPLGHNFIFDYTFIYAWLRDLYFEIFSPFYRDTMQIALYLNDRQGMAGERALYNKVRLNWLCNHYGIPYERGHDAMQDCLMTAQIYQKLLQSQGKLV
jgi:DNA polymerase III epsilon subunit-like protein